jgi:hypothetical protein
MLNVTKNFLSESHISTISKYQSLNTFSATQSEDFETIKEIIKLIKNKINVDFSTPELYLENVGIKTNFVGESIPLHYDASGITLGRREYAVHLYLNNDFTGGEISYPNQEFNEKPESNTLIIFPTTEEYSHEMKTVLSGERRAMLIHFTTNKDLAYAHSMAEYSSI